MKTLTTPLKAVEQIDAVCKLYAASRSNLADRLSALQAEIEQVKNRHLRGIKTAVTPVINCKAELEALLKANPEIFVQPRTMTLHGIKVGYQKGKGRLEWDDEQKVVDRLLKCGERIEDRDPGDFLDTVTTPRKDMLLELPAAALKKLGCRIEGTGDSILIKVGGSDVDKFVARLIEEGTQNAEETAA